LTGRRGYGKRTIAAADGVFAFLAVMSGADGWGSIERYGVMRRKRLGKFLRLAEGIPKHDVYRRVLGAIRSELLESCFINWVRDIKRDIKQEVVESTRETGGTGQVNQVP
jgi:hypothetical protein